jgi:hypothetical protein
MMRCSSHMASELACRLPVIITGWQRLPAGGWQGDWDGEVAL